MAAQLGSMNRPLVRAQRLVRSHGSRRVLDGIDLQIAAGEFVALLGRSGSGKSTLLRAMAELDHEVSGSGTLDVPVERAVVFQDARLLPWAPVIENVMLGLQRGRRPGTESAEQRARAALEEVGLRGRERAFPVELSGGEQQRVALARALIREPRLLLADEPFGALDALTRLRMHELLGELCARHRPGVLLVTHDVDEAISLADRVLVLTEGRITLDQRITIPSPRAARDARFQEYRELLLIAIGVTAGQHVAPARESRLVRDASGP